MRVCLQEVPLRRSQVLPRLFQRDIDLAHQVERRWERLIREHLVIEIGKNAEVVDHVFLGYAVALFNLNRVTLGRFESEKRIIERHVVPNVTLSAAHHVTGPCVISRRGVADGILFGIVDVSARQIDIDKLLGRDVNPEVDAAIAFVVVVSKGASKHVDLRSRRLSPSYPLQIGRRDCDFLRPP